MTTLARIAMDIPFENPANAWERSANWLISHYPIALYIFVVIPLSVVVWTALT